MPFILSAALLLYDNALSYFGAIQVGSPFPPIYVFRVRTEPTVGGPLQLCEDASAAVLVVPNDEGGAPCEHILSSEKPIYSGIVVRIQKTRLNTSAPILDVYTSGAPFFVGTDRNYQSLVLSDVDYTWIR